MAKLTVVNPSERDYKSQRFVLWVGACAPTYLLVWGHLEDALEECADWLAENAPGHLMLEGHGNDERDPELDSLLAEECEERGLEWPIPDSVDGSDSDAMQPYWDAEERAYADLTRTERGFIPSDDWGIALDNPDRAELKAFIAELDARNYGDEPTVDITRPKPRPAKPVTHWVYGSGLPGYMYDNQGTADTQADAIESALFIFKDDLSEDEYAAARSELESSGLHYFPSERRGELGASLVEVSEEPGPRPLDEGDDHSDCENCSECGAR